MTQFVFGRRSKRFLYGHGDIGPVLPITIELCNRALRYSSVDFGIIDGRRTAEQQRELYNNGSTTLDGVTALSDHQYGLAIDVLPVVRDENNNKLNPFDIDNIIVRDAWLEVYRAFMRAGMKLKITLEFGLGYNISGGRDWPHISIKGGYDDSLIDYNKIT